MIFIKVRSQASIFKKAVLLFFITCCYSFSFAQPQPDDICGYWRTLKGNTQIEVFKSSTGMYFGRIIWLKVEKDRPDYKNPNEKLRLRKILGLQIVNNFIFNGKNGSWDKGTIYDPENGETYVCVLKLGNNTKDILKLKGHLPGMKVLSRQTEWIRESKPRP